MQLYAVRFKNTKEPVGFFFVKSVDDLWMNVDAFAEAGNCEYMTVTTRCAIVWPRNPGWKMGEESDEEEIPFSDGLQFDEGLLGVLLGFDKSQWEPVVSSVPVAKTNSFSD